MVEIFRRKPLLQTGLFALWLLIATSFATPGPAAAQTTAPLPLVAIHVSEITAALETMPAVAPTPTGSGTTGYQWYYQAWRYFVAYESLKEALRSDGTQFVVVSDSDISSGRLLNTDGSPRYPILISLTAEAIADSEVAPLRSYVNAGGFLLAGSSSFTRNPDGTSRQDFALASEMGVHTANASLLNWYANTTLTKTTDHRLISHIPSGTLAWLSAQSSDEIPLGVSPAHPVHTWHFAWQVIQGDATVLAQGDAGPLLTVKNYGQGQFIFHGPFQPIIGHGGFDSGMYAYVIYRKAIEWAFESFNVPIVKVSPWRYPYDAALTVRHDYENVMSLIQTVESSAQFEQSVGAKGDYYFCTGALRTYTGADRGSTIISLQNAVSSYGATIGSHNGGLKNPVNAALQPSDYDYWHWGPDEALDQTVSGYTSGKAYALASIQASFADIEGWLKGLDNGRAGCGAAGNCPRLWVSPAFNSTREDSYDILGQLNSATMGEQKISPFPHWSISYKTPGKRYPHVTLPTSDWYVGTGVAQSSDTHSVASIRAGIDFYYGLGTLINFYGHAPSNNGGVEQELVTYAMAKPATWATNAVGVYDWWRLRSNVTVTPGFTNTGGSYTVTATVSGSTDANTAVELALPTKTGTSPSGIQVFLDGSPAPASEYRTVSYGGVTGVKVRVGTSISTVQVQYVVASPPPVAADDSFIVLEGTTLQEAQPGVLANDTGSTLSAQLVTGPGHGSLTLLSNGSFTYTPTAGYIGSDSFTYRASNGTTTSTIATVTILVRSASTMLFSDDFTRSTGTDPKPFTWTVPTLSGAYPNHGTFNTANGTLNCATDVANNFGIAYSTSLVMGNHSVEADIEFANAGSLGGGILGRLNSTTGQYYSAWIYPEGSAGKPSGYGPASLTLVKMYNWSAWRNDPLGMMTVSIPALGMGWHHLKMTFSGNRIQVYYDGSTTPVIDVVDNNSGGVPAYTSGYPGVDFFAYGNTYGPTCDNFIVRDSTGAAVYTEDFGTNTADPLSPWSRVSGSWTVANGIMQVSGSPSEYAAIAYPDTTPSWGDYLLQAQVSFATGAFGGGVCGRVSPATGARYCVVVLPDGSAAGSNTMKIIKFRAGSPWAEILIGQASLPSVGTGWHLVQVLFAGSRIMAYYDGLLEIDVTDNGFGSTPAYLTGGVSVEMYTDTTPYIMSVDNFVVSTP